MRAFSVSFEDFRFEFLLCLSQSYSSLSLSQPLSVLSSLLISLDLSLSVLLKPVKNLLVEYSEEASLENKVNMIFYFS